MLLSPPRPLLRHPHVPAFTADPLLAGTGTSRCPRCKQTVQRSDTAEVAHWLREHSDAHSW